MHGSLGTTVVVPLARMLQASVIVNVELGVFNLFPVLPLDGGRVLFSILPIAAARAYAQTERYGFLILLLLLYTHWMDVAIYPVMNLAIERDLLDGAAVSDENESSTPPKLGADAGVRFRLPIYEGPLDLLLHLLKRAELDPHEVTASVITEQYLAGSNCSTS